MGKPEDVRANTLIIIGAGGQGAVVADILLRAYECGSPARPIGFADDTPHLLGTAVLGIPVLGPLASLSTIPHDAVIVAVGDNSARCAITKRILRDGERLVTAIHPRACASPTATIGEGSVICAGAIVGARTVIGQGVIINTGASVDHDCVIGEFAHVSAGATVGARVHIGAEALIAIGASIASQMTIGAHTTIGCGAVVVRAVPDDVVAFGVPARVRRNRTR
ncbi:MAG TPA: acetyltransferase [Vicinamibacterales bacterium]|nr:acetyltransferase [Vicinamibacterales bacterium]